VTSTLRTLQQLAARRDADGARMRGAAAQEQREVSAT